MKIRDKILIYFSSTIILVTAVSVVIIYLLFSAHREEEFQQQQYSKIKYTIGLIDEFNNISAEVSKLLDKQDIHDFYDEKLLIYDQNKQLIFSSIDDLDISRANSILNKLSVSLNWIETDEDSYDLIGVYIEHKGKSYYAISKAYDYYGHSKKDFLLKVLILIFLSVVIIVILISIYLANIIAKPLAELTNKLENYDLSNSQHNPLIFNTSTIELQNLALKFNELSQRTNEAFLFQKNSIHHISHELRTPIAVLVSELEMLQNYTDLDLIKHEIEKLTVKTQSLGNLINALLQISKIEAGQEISYKNLRIDDLLFDCIAEVNILYPNFNFQVDFTPINFNESLLNVNANPALIKQAFMNLILNSIQYADQNKAKVTFDSSQNSHLQIYFTNTGQTLSKEEQEFLFSHFFRGSNAKNKNGFGLGLVLSQKIFAAHQMEIQYSSRNETENTFTIRFP